jgi:RPA family protein
MSPDTQDQFKRHIAFKLRIGDIARGQAIMNYDRFSYLDLDGKKVVRVNVIGNITEKYDSEGEKRYSFLTLDDGSGQIKLKSFGDDTEKLKDIVQGQTVIVIGVLRNFNNETYISPEIIKEQDPKYLLVRKMEVEKNMPKGDEVPKEKIVAVKDKILGVIKNAGDEGVYTDLIKTEMKEISAEIIDQEVQKFLKEGIIFEPRPGKVKYLG